MKTFQYFFFEIEDQNKIQIKFRAILSIRDWKSDLFTDITYDSCNESICYCSHHLLEKSRNSEISNSSSYQRGIDTVDKITTMKVTLAGNMKTSLC